MDLKTKLLAIDNPNLAADALGYVLYGVDARFWEFHRAFLDGIEAEQVSEWIPAPGQGAAAVGWTLGAVWYNRRI